MRAIQRKNRLVVFLLLVLTLVWMCDTNVQAATNYTKKVTNQNVNFEISAEYGLNGLVYYDMPAMVSVTVKCKENFVGTLQLIPSMDSGSTKVAYGEDISLSAGEEKTFYFTPSSIGNSGTIYIQVLNEKGKLVYGEMHQVLLESGGSKVSVGILSDDYSALSYFDGIGTKVNGSEGITSVFELTKDSFPKNELGLEMLQYMLIDNYDTANLSKEQFAALKNWVQNGGVLILGLGSNYQNVLHAFQDSFITGTLGTLSEKSVTWDALSDATAITGLKDNQESVSEETTTESVESKLSQEQNVTTEEMATPEDYVQKDAVNGASLNVECIAFELEGGESFSDQTTEGTAYSKQIGRGRVVVLGYSMAMEPMTSSPARKSIAKFILETSWTEGTDSKFYGGSYNNGLYSGLDVAQLADTTRKPSAILYGFIFLVYVLLVGPVLYLILKAMNKRENIWIAIPCVTLVFTAIMYFSGFLYRINKPLVSTFTVVELQENVKTESIYTNILCPKPKEYTMQFASDYTGFQRNLNEYSYSMFDTEYDATAYDYILKKNSKGTEMTLHTSEPFKNTSFILSNTDENNIGSLDSDIKGYTSGFEGTVTNNTCYDLSDVVVTYENYICLIGDMKKGETVTIDSQKIIQSDSYGSYESLNKSKNLYTDRNLYLRYQVSNMVETNVIDKTAYRTGYIWAQVASYKPEITKDSDVKRTGCGVLLTSYQADYEDVTGVFYPMIDGMAIATQGEYDEYDRNIYSSEVIITYSFEDCPGITCLENMSTSETSTETYLKPAEVYAYNIETGEYDPIFTDSNVLEGDELKKYMLGNVIMLNYMQDTSGYGAYIPRISARGDE